MPKNTTLLILSFSFITASSTAQTRFTVTFRCGKADPSYTLQVGDKPSHAYQLSKVTCVPTKTFRIAGVEEKEAVVTAFGELIGPRSRGQSSQVVIMANGDKVFVRTRDAGSVENTFGGSGTFTGGTGKFKDLKGKSTFECKPVPDDTELCKVTGSYSLPASDH